MARPASSKRSRPGRVSIIGSDGDKLAWRVTGDDGKPLRPRFGKVIIHGGAADAGMFRMSSKAIQDALKEILQAEPAVAPKGKGSRQKRGYGVTGIGRSHEILMRSMRAKGGASKSDRGLAEELD